MEQIIKKLYDTKDISDSSLAELLKSEDIIDLLHEYALKRRKEYYNNDVYIRGLIEFSNYCKNNCYYCGIRAENCSADRYRLTEEDILSCADDGYNLGFRTFVLQSGEDLSYSDDDICHIGYKIKSA